MPLARQRMQRTAIASCASLTSSVGPQTGHEDSRAPRCPIRRSIHAPQEGVFLADSHLFSAASFYELFSLKPLGRHVIRFCESAPCHVMGGRQVIDTLQQELGLKPGETSGDLKWSLLMTSCLGVCGVGPVFLVDEDIYGNVTPEQVSRILARYE